MQKAHSISGSNSMQRTSNADWFDHTIMPTKNIINNMGDIQISPALWRYLNAKYSRSAIKRLISKAIQEHNVPLPLVNISHRTVLKLFNRLKHSDSRSKLCYGKVHNRFEYKWPVDDIYIGVGNTFNAASNYFHQRSRWSARSDKHQSPSDAWCLPRNHNTFLNGLWSMKHPKVTKTILNNTISLKFYVASQFKPQAAKVIYELFNADRVLDPSSGWGDRLCGFCSTNGSKYVGLDPNTSLIEGYRNQIHTYGGNKQIEMVCTGSEFYDPNGQKFDTIFTSPPYFSIEHYSIDENQSFKLYNNIDAWKNNFLFKTLDMAWKALDYKTNPDRGGILCMNISDIMIKNNTHKICDDMNDYLSKKKGARYIGCIGLRLALRPNIIQESAADVIFVEPVWIWAKGGKWTLADYIKHGFVRKQNPGLFE